VPLPHAEKVTFTAAGTFKYICFLHGSDMAGTVIVTP
jgi:plastocyanin